ncbi:hypothetical protein Tco_0019534, partial [Tanacetum coccineum]
LSKKSGRTKIKQNNGKKDAPVKEKVTAIYMIQLWHKVTRQKVTLSFAHVNEITFPPLSANKGTEGPLVIEAEIGGYAIHRESEHFTKAWINFMIVRSPSPYNGIIGRPGIREIQVVPSMAHGMLKFPVNGGVVTIRSTILTPNECATITATSKDSIKKIEGGQKNLKVAIHHDFPDQEVALGGTLSIEGRTTLCALLKRNLDIFTWQPSNMTGVPWQIAEHRLNIWDGYPRSNRKRGAKLRNEPRPSKKSWRMFVDFTNLNKACPQDCYLLSEIDWNVESLSDYPFKCFLDAYKGYHQIQMAEVDEEKMTFHTPHGVYCYTKMPFGLKNAESHVSAAGRQGI